jgi:flagellin-like hook-associated protein FlgL
MRRILLIILAVVAVLFVIWLLMRNRGEDTAVQDPNAISETTGANAGGGITTTDPNATTDSATTDDATTGNATTTDSSATGNATTTDSSATDGATTTDSSAADSATTTDSNATDSAAATDSSKDTTTGTTATTPDSDGDGVADGADACPNDFGTQADGCGQAAPADTTPLGPGDSDGDGIADSADDCPLHWGDQSNGCPAAFMGGIPVFRVCSVVANQSVTIETRNLTPNQSFTALMGVMHTQGINGFPVTQFDSGAGGTQRLTFTIPAELTNSRQIALRLTTSHQYPFYAYNWFFNNSTTADYCP